MKKIVIIPNTVKDKGFTVTDKVVEKLLSIGATVYVNNNVGYTNSAVNGYENMPRDIDLIIVVGGDGSVIDASEYAIRNNIPILGVNLGKVGYLTEVEVDNLDVLDKLTTADYSITEKMLLSVEVEGEASPCGRYAVNDITISRDSFVHIADIGIEDSIGNVLKLRADGLILATPQGSTAYSLSSGGPVVAHDVESILVTPVCAHSFFNRSVLFNSTDVLTVTNTGAGNLNVCIDGRVVGALAPGNECSIKKADKSFKTLTFSKNSMFTGLFKKMSILEGFK